MKNDSLGRRRHPAQNAGRKKPAPGDKGTGLACPSHLDAQGKRIWRAVVKELRRMNALDTHDAVALEMFATNYSLWRKAIADIAKNGALVDCESGRGYQVTKPNPFIRIAEGSSKICMQLFSVFGIGPVLRAKLLEETSTSEEEEFDKFLNS